MVRTAKSAPYLGNVGFKGFDKVAPGSRKRRQAETMCIPALRDWMQTFAVQAIAHIEAWRDDV